jgi:hypothetical protein
LQLRVIAVVAAKPEKQRKPRWSMATLRLTGDRGPFASQRRGAK